MTFVSLVNCFVRQSVGERGLTNRLEMNFNKLRLPVLFMFRIQCSVTLTQILSIKMVDIESTSRPAQEGY